MRLQPSSLVYQGAFRLPKGYDFGGTPLAFNPARQSLIVGRRGLIGEVSIPAPTTGAITELNQAVILQPLIDPFDGRIGDIAGDASLASLAGMLVHGNRLIMTASVYYDANNQQRVSHGTRSLDFAVPDFSGFVSVGNPDRTGYVAGYMAAIPAEHQAALKGTLITGQFGTPIVMRTSLGPAAFAFNFTDLLAGRSVPATPLVYYDMAHPTLGRWDSTNETYGGMTNAAGVVLAHGTALFFGRNGVGPFCYGSGTGDQAKVGTINPADGDPWCYDPIKSDHGQHAYPYRHQVWAYDVEDLALVAAGTIQPWEVLPYAVWELPLPFPDTTSTSGSVAFDPSTNTIYLSQMQADQDGYAYRALVHVFTIGPVAVPPPIVIPPPIAVTPELRDLRDRLAVAALKAGIDPARCYLMADAVLKRR